MATGALATEPQDFARYQIIVDRSPFGAVAAANTPDAAPSFSKRFQLTGGVTSNGAPGIVLAVISDTESNRSLYKAEGDMIDGDIKVLRIQDGLTTKAKVVLQFGLEKAELTLQNRPNTVVVGVPGQPQPAPGVMPPRPRIPFRRSN